VQVLTHDSDEPNMMTNRKTMVSQEIAETDDYIFLGCLN